MRKPSPATAIAVVALFIALGGAGMAATGGNFILGNSNSATSSSALSAPVAGRALQVSNTSATAGATALGLNVAPGHAPFTVNSTSKVTNLNADALDGIDSAGFAQGNNVRLLSARVTTPIDSSFPYVPVITVPGFGELKGQCPDFNGVYDGFFHASSSGWSSFYQLYDHSPPFTSYYAGGGSFSQLQAGDGGADHVGYLILQGSGATATSAMIDLYTNWNATTGCLFKAQVLISQGG